MQNLPYRSFFPEANQSEWERKSKNGERIVRCFQLINPDVELSDLIEKDCVDVDEDNEIPGTLFFVFCYSEKLKQKFL